MKKNEYYNVKITDLTLDGNGVCRVEGMTVFVPHTAIGAPSRIKIVNVLKHYAFGIVAALEKASVDRIEPVCR
ncbi:MAG: TRAM domain-containing protein, partial [Ruminococcus sp.]|nr:TRAM domain-containing protein [Ruminococcus sp.]